MRRQMLRIFLAVALLVFPLQTCAAEGTAEELLNIFLGKLQSATEQRTENPQRLYEELRAELESSEAARGQVRQYVLASRAVTAKHAREFRAKEIFVFVARKIPVVGRGFSNVLLEIFVNEYKEDLLQKDAESAVQSFIKLRGLAIAAGQECFEWQLDHPEAFEGDVDKEPAGSAVGRELREYAEKLNGYVECLAEKSGVAVKKDLDAGNLFSLQASETDYDKGEDL